jgi:TM2 domain-containing membrane protein YozV
MVIHKILVILIALLVSSQVTNAAWVAPTTHASIASQGLAFTNSNSIQHLPANIPYNDKPRDKESESIIAAALALLLGVYGVHNFYMGNKSKGLRQLLLYLNGMLFYIIGASLVGSSTFAVGTSMAGAILLVAGISLLLISWSWAIIDMVLILTNQIDPRTGKMATK